jgi:acyl-coenzyme A thioesterase PaaI-like protein
MVKLSIELGIPAVTAQMDIRLRRAIPVGEKITFLAEVKEDTRKLLVAYAKAVTDGDEIVAESKGKLVKITNHKL